MASPSNPVLSNDAPVSGASFAYRPALDGVRAVAVYLVVLFHAGMSSVSNGFVGVDLFFVLSGFLVTNVLLGELTRTGTLSLRRFYARRVRRLLPASAAAIVGSAIVGLVAVAPPARPGVATDARWSALYSANWRFRSTATDYFADTDPSPYLHYWSLAIEEQFYIVFPVVVVLLWKFRGRRAAVIGLGIAAAASFAMQMMLGSSGELVDAYFRTDARVYQLLAGALLALLIGRVTPRIPSIVGRWAALAGLLGLFALGSSLIDMSVPVRGVWAVIASLAIVLGLEMGADRATMGALASRPVVLLGTISYGTYLWHWPILFVAKALVDIPPWTMAIVVGLLASAAAWVSSRLIERPVRHAPHLDPFPRIVVGVGLLLSVATALVATVVLSSTSPSLLHVGALESGAATVPEALRAELGAAPRGVDWGAMKRSGAHMPRDANRCYAKDISGCVDTQGSAGTILLVGDSHAEAMVPYFRDLAERRDMTLMTSIVLGCPWIDSQALVHKEPDTECGRLRADWSSELVNSTGADVVVLVSYFRQMVTDPDRPVQGQLLGRSMRTTVQNAADAGARVVVVGGLPVFASDPMNCLADSREVADCTIVQPDARDTLSVFFERLGQLPGVDTVDLRAVACSRQPLCPPFDRGEFVYRDTDHVMPTWWLSNAEAVDEILAPSLADPPD